MCLTSLNTRSFNTDIKLLNAIRSKSGKTEVYSNVVKRCSISLRFIRDHLWEFEQTAKALKLETLKNEFDFPIIHSNFLRDYLFSQAALDLAIEAGWVTKHKVKKLDLDNASDYFGVYTQFYYLFTENGKNLFRDTESPLNDSEQKILDRYINALNHSEYSHVIESMKHFRFNLAGKQKDKKQKQFISRVMGGDADGVHIARLQYQRFYKFSQVKPVEYPLYCSNDLDSWAGRFYSPFVNCSSEGRYAIEYIDNPKEQLVSLDFATFQIHCLVKVFKDLGLGGDFPTLIEDLTTKDFYEEVGKVRFNKPSITKTERKKVKGNLLSAIFDNPRKKCPVCDAIQKLYPEFTTALNRLKTEPHTEFIKKKGRNRRIFYKQGSFYGTVYEVRLMKQIWSALDARGIHFLTIHDAVIVPKQFEKQTADIMNDAALQFFGYAPKVEPEDVK